MVRVVSEYAPALLELTIKNGNVEQVLRDCYHYLELHTDEMGDPTAVPEGTLRDFMLFLQQKDRLDCAGPILKGFLELALEHIGVIKVEVVSAVPLSQAQLESLQRRLIMRSGKRVHMTHRVDDSLIAGLRLISDGVVMDTSVKSQLTDIRDKLYRGGVFRPWTQ